MRAILTMLPPIHPRMTASMFLAMGCIGVRFRKDEKYNNFKEEHAMRLSFTFQPTSFSSHEAYAFNYFG